MSIAKGFLSIAGFKKATTWGTPVACGAGDGIEILSESIKLDRALIEDMQITGSSSQREGDAGNKIYGGEVPMGARYEGLEVPLALGFGTAGAPTTVDTTAKLHKLKLKNDLAGLLATMALQKTFEVHEFTTVKVLGFSFKCRQGERAEISVRLALHDVNINTASGTNNNTTIATVTLPANRDFLLFGHLIARINDQASGALGGSDVVYVNEISCDVDRSFATDDVTTAGGFNIDEPVQDNFTKVKGTLTVSKYMDGTGGSNALFAQQLTKARKKMDWKFTSPKLAGAATEFFSWLFQFPNVQFMDGTPNVPGPGRLGYSLNFVAYRVTAAPTGMTGVTEPLDLWITNQRTTDPLT